MGRQQFFPDKAVYNRLVQMCEKVEKLPFAPFAGTDTEAIAAMSEACHTDFHHVKPIKPLPSRKSEEPVPWFNCFEAPCKGGCPIEQDIPESIELCRKGLYDEALRLITEKNPLPFITGTTLIVWLPAFSPGMSAR